MVNYSIIGIMVIYIIWLRLKNHFLSRALVDELVKNHKLENKMKNIDEFLRNPNIKE